LNRTFDIIVVGAGHAGCEAAHAAAKLGSRVLLITMNMTNMAQMSCNPSMGGIAKGQIVREIDALGGCSGIITDNSTIQFRMLNRSKGPAMWSPRAQNDRALFSEEWRRMLEKNNNVFFWQDSVVDLIVKRGAVEGVITGLGITFHASAVILANGTFLNGTIYVGERKLSGGRIGEKSALNLTERLIEYGFTSNRMKTGTPARVDGRSLDFSVMEEQKGDENPGKFSYSDTKPPVEQRSCYLTYTSEEVHEILRTGFDQSPMFTGKISGRGPRYCPSIEDKIDRFASKNRHQLFIEPEGWNTVEYYVNGFSSSLPEEVQFNALRKVRGFENAFFFRPGYAIEYDYFPPDQLFFNLETKKTENLFFAGQINGTTGYEEAAAQGLMAGINAHLKITGQSPFVLKRSEAYIGVLIDDLITKGTEEPYRMFTSRAEFRLLLRQDNADQRLSNKAYDLGMISRNEFERVEDKYQGVGEVVDFLKNCNVMPNEINPLLEERDTAAISQKLKAGYLLLRPQIHLNDLISSVPEIEKFIEDKGFHDRELLDEAEVMIKYESYIAKEQQLAEKITSMEDYPIATDFNFMTLSSISIEAREKLTKVRPMTIGQASRISGVSPADISVLLVYLGR
jgi:tRNA uridine 5-carboxymethylaminomethyl modification enzyme